MYLHFQYLAYKLSLDKWLETKNLGELQKRLGNTVESMISIVNENLPENSINVNGLTDLFDGNLDDAFIRSNILGKLGNKSGKPFMSQILFFT